MDPQLTQAFRTWTAIVVAVAAVAAILVYFANPLLGAEAGPYWIVLFIGGMVGSTELMSRYKDAPFRPLLSLPGLVYVALNGGAAILAYYLLGALGVDLSAGNDEAKERIYRVMLASLGAMAFFRSGLFTLRLGDSDVPVGPNLILQVLLNALDRTYDRVRAAPRSVEASRIMAGISFELAQEALPTFCFNLMQNVADDELEEIGREVGELAQATSMSDEAKSLILGLALLNVVGEKTLQSAVWSLGGSIRGSQVLSVELLAALAKTDPAMVVQHLPRVVRTLVDPQSRRMQEADFSEINALELPNENKAIILTHVLVRYYGERSVTTALSSLVPLPGGGGCRRRR